MNITTHEINDILKTLPIGYYCGRRINVSLTDEMPTSCYIPATDEIVIGAPVIKEGLQSVEETPEFTKETAIRSMLYHEVSHAILTPHEWHCDDIGNVFEDERIETLLKGYYLDTNFKENLKNIMGDKPIDYNDPKQNFFSTVRFRTGKKEFVDRVEQIIDKYSDVNNQSGYYNENGRRGYGDYDCAIRRLYDDICADLRQNPMSQKEQEELNKQVGEKLNQMSEEEEQMMKDNQEKRASQKPNKGQDQNQKDQQDGESQSEGQGEGENQEQQNLQPGQEGQDGESGDDDEDLPQGKKAGLNLLKNALSEISNKYHDPELAQQLDMIFSNFSKKNSGGNSTVAYNGRINPRNFIRDDYKYFDKKVPVNGNNKYGTCHLNLFIDDSGSFSNHIEKVNTLLAELSRIEDKNKNFTYDLILCSDGMRETTRRTRYVTARGGTHLHFEETEKIFRSHQKTGTLVYNIVLYDGDCMAYGQSKYGYPHPFKFFDKKNVTMILEDSNKSDIMDCNMTSANIVYENRDYTGQLTKHVLRALNIAFR